MTEAEIRVHELLRTKEESSNPTALLGARTASPLQSLEAVLLLRLLDQENRFRSPSDLVVATSYNLSQISMGIRPLYSSSFTLVPKRCYVIIEGIVNKIKR